MKQNIVMNLLKSPEKYCVHYVIILFVISVSLSSVHSYGYDTFDDFPGAYCRRRGCCYNRQDNCSIPISTTLCYCDEFCDRSRSGDCCPDYMTYCRNAPPPPPPVVRCFYKGRYFDRGQQIKDNCNVCTCQANTIVTCDQKICIQDDAIINNINSISHTLGWTAKNYSEFWGHDFTEGLSRRLGTLEPTYRSKAMSRLTTKIHGLPREFNALTHWPNLISEIRDQGWCGSSWILSTISVASDRFAIQSKGKEIVQLSPQHILSCARRQRGCDGGHIDAAWRFLNKRGTVDENCYPYEGRVSRCRITRTHSLRAAGCSLPTKVDRDYFYTMGPAYSLYNETDIMNEIELSGPVQATMRVYRDFFSYSEGIYRHSTASRETDYGFHSVRLVGWGEDYQGYGKTVKYWIAANTWGTWWGENGFFKILRGQNECLIEDYVLASWPHLYNSYGELIIDGQHKLECSSSILFIRKCTGNTMSRFAILI